MSGNGIAARDARGCFVRGGPPGTGLPVGSRCKLSEGFLADLFADWVEHGAAVLDRVRQDDPIAYLRIVAGLCKDYRIEVSRGDDFADAESPEEILARLEERAGPRAAAVLRAFIAELPRPRFADDAE
jgi:hypothetical protein